MENKFDKIMSDMQKPQVPEEVDPFDIVLLGNKNAWHNSITEEDAKILHEGVRVLSIQHAEKHGIVLIIAKNDKAPLAEDTFQGLMHLAKMCEEALRVMSRRAKAVGHV